jgi:hypothetical protein
VGTSKWILTKIAFLALGLHQHCSETPQHAFATVR